MVPELWVILSVAAVALALGWVIGATLSRRRESTDLPAMVNHIDQVRTDLRQLTNLFLVPRTRGAVGETLLAELLSNWLPQKSFDLQHGFSNGSRVDAVIRLGNRLVPIDSKFPMEAFLRFVESGDQANAAPGSATPGTRSLPGDLKRGIQKHIADIATRYIRPDEGTMGFALMYIPSEGVYYRLFVDTSSDLMDEALRHNIVPVSPGTLFAYVQTVAYGLRGLALPDDVRKLSESLTRLRSDISQLVKAQQVAGTHLRNLNKAFEDTVSRSNRIEVHTDQLLDMDQD